MDKGTGLRCRCRSGIRAFSTWMDSQWSAVPDIGLLSSDWTNTMVTVLLAASLLLATASVVFAVSQPGEEYTEFYLLTDNETGTPVATDYPENLTRGESTPVVVGISNHEQEHVRYSVVAEFQRVRITDTTNTTVVEERASRPANVTLGPGETRHVSSDLTPPIAGENIRIRFYLFTGESPANPTVANAYRELHLWVNVSSHDA